MCSNKSLVHSFQFQSGGFNWRVVLQSMVASNRNGICTLRSWQSTSTALAMSDLKPVCDFCSSSLYAPICHILSLLAPPALWYLILQPSRPPGHSHLRHPWRCHLSRFQPHSSLASRSPRNFRLCPPCLPFRLSHLCLFSLSSNARGVTLHDNQLVGKWPSCLSVSVDPNTNSYASKQGLAILSAFQVMRGKTCATRNSAQSTLQCTLHAIPVASSQEDKWDVRGKRE